MKHRAKLHRLNLNVNGFAFDPATGQSYTFNPSSLRIIAWLKAGHSEEELPTRLADEFDIAPGVARRDVERFLATLRGYRLL
jgi:PqqD family protein of HPr-rel-A system